MKQRMINNTPSVIIIPMIDIMLFLLVFVLIFAISVDTTSKLDVDLPTSSTVVTSYDRTVSISIHDSGDIYVDNNPVELSMLSDILNNYNDTVVSINADKNVRYERIVDVISAVNQSHIHTIGLSVIKQ